MFRAIAESYKRWRHSRGYGVHSPFAYRMVKEVVRPGRDYAWYGYDTIDTANVSPVLRREARMLLRMAAFLGIRTAFLPPDAPQVLRDALRGADSRIMVHNRASELDLCDLICSRNDYIDADTLSGLLQKPGRAIVVRSDSDSLAASLFDSLPTGMMLRSRLHILVISRPEMQKVAYTIKF